MRRALISGVAGQDGSYLAKLLLEKGYEVIGTSRDAMMASFDNLNKLGIAKEVKTTSMAITDFHSVFNVIQKYQPDEIYNLAGQTSVALSFEQPAEAVESIAGGTLNILEVLRFLDKPVRFYNAGSSESFGDTQGNPANEKTPFKPRSPYAVAKASAYWLVDNYREAHNIYACTGILFNHESPLRPSRFVTQKIIATAKRIAAGSGEVLTLGRMDISRDWGWAPEYVDAMWRMLQLNKPEDFVIATGKTYLLEDFVRLVFASFDLDWREHVKQSDEFMRPTDLLISKADPSKAKKLLDWEAKIDMPQVIRNMIQVG